MLRGYDRSLKIVLRHRFATLIISNLIFAVTIYLFVIMPKGFLPSEDTGQIFGFTEAAQGISFESMKEHQQKVAAIVRQDPNVDSFMSGVGPVGTMVGINTGRVFIRLKPRSERRLSADADHPGTPAETGDGSRNPGLSAKPSADPHRRNTDQEPVSVYSAEPEHEGAF